MRWSLRDCRKILTTSECSFASVTLNWTLNGHDIHNIASPVALRFVCVTEIDRVLICIFVISFSVPSLVHFTRVNRYGARYTNVDNGSVCFATAFVCSSTTRLRRCRAKTRTRREIRRRIQREYSHTVVSRDSVPWLKSTSRQVFGLRDGKKIERKRTYVACIVMRRRTNGEHGVSALPVHFTPSLSLHQISHANVVRTVHFKIRTI